MKGLHTFPVPSVEPWKFKFNFELNKNKSGKKLKFNLSFLVFILKKKKR